MSNYRIYSNVQVGQNCRFGDFSSIGLPPRGHSDGELATRLGDRAEIQSHATICAGNVIGDDFVAGHGFYMRHNCRFGHRVQIGPHGVVEWDVTIGDDVTVGPQVGIAEFTIIEAGVTVGPQVGIAGVLHPLCSKSKQCAKGPHLYRGVSVGAGATVHPDLRIGEGALIEPGSVVVRDVLPFTVVAGNPAAPIGDVFALFPGLLERVGRFVCLEKEAIAQIRQRFEKQPSRFAAR